MSTFMFKNFTHTYTPVSNIFIEKYMPKARGEYVKVYLLGIKYCMTGEIGVNSSILANTLHLLQTDVVNAWNYWNDEGVVSLVPIDDKGNFNVEFLNLEEPKVKEDVDLLKELNNNSTKDMLHDIEKLVGRPLSTKEMSLYISWINDFSFMPEIILILIQYCSSKGKTDYRYLEKVAIAWHEAKISTMEDAQTFIKKHEDKWMNIRKILSYMGIKDAEIMKPQQEMIEKWLYIYKFPVDVVLKACEVCFERLSRADFKYVDGILGSWFKNGIKSVEDIPIKDLKKSSVKKTYTSNKTNFNNYTQRTYDFDDLEKKLLEWENKYD